MHPCMLIIGPIALSMGAKSFHLVQSSWVLSSPNVLKHFKSHSFLVSQGYVIDMKCLVTKSVRAMVAQA